MARQESVRIKLEDGRDLLIKLRTSYFVMTGRLVLFALGGLAFVAGGMMYRYGYKEDALIGIALGFGMWLLAKE